LTQAQTQGSDWDPERSGFTQENRRGERFTQQSTMATQGAVRGKGRPKVNPEISKNGKKRKKDASFRSRYEPLSFISGKNPSEKKQSSRVATRPSTFVAEKRPVARGNQPKNPRRFAPLQFEDQQPSYVRKTKNDVILVESSDDGDDATCDHHDDNSSDDGGYQGNGYQRNGYQGNEGHNLNIPSFMEDVDCGAGNAGMNFDEVCNEPIRSNHSAKSRDLNKPRDLHTSQFIQVPERRREETQTFYGNQDLARNQEELQYFESIQEECQELAGSQEELPDLRCLVNRGAVVQGDWKLNFYSKLLQRSTEK